MYNLAKQNREAERPRVSVNLILPAKMAGLEVPHRYKVFYGGRAGTKSWSVARWLVTLAARERIRVLCCRELQKSIKDSVHRLLVDQIEALGLEPFYDTPKSEIRCTSTGSLFIFEGLAHNVTKIKSLEGIDICWVEEAQRVSEDSWKTLIPTIRKAGSEIWVTFNPDLETDPTYQRFVINTPPHTKLVKLGADDNPWLSQEMKDERDHLYRVDPDAAAHIWGGEIRTSSDAQILHGKCKVEAFKPGEDWDGPYQGADWGFSQDPTTLVRCWVRTEQDGKHEKRWLYVERESYAVKLELTQTAERFRRDISGCEGYTIRADNARPETINHVKKDGLDIISVDKWPGSVEDGIAYLRGFEEIIIHPRCVHFEQESRLYSYKEDRLTGDILTAIIDRHNHMIDATRYALSPLIRMQFKRKAKFL